jgi:hypothetical protein
MEYSMRLSYREKDWANPEEIKKTLICLRRYLIDGYFIHDSDLYVPEEIYERVIANETVYGFNIISSDKLKLKYHTPMSTPGTPFIKRDGKVIMEYSHGHEKAVGSFLRYCNDCEGKVILDNIAPQLFNCPECDKLINLNHRKK